MKKLISFILMFILIFTSFAQTICFAEEKNATPNHSVHVYQKAFTPKTKIVKKLSEKFKIALYLVSAAALAGSGYLFKDKFKAFISKRPSEINDSVSAQKDVNIDADETIKSDKTSENINNEILYNNYNSQDLNIDADETLTPSETIKPEDGSNPDNQDITPENEKQTTQDSPLSEVTNDKSNLTTVEVINNYENVENISKTDGQTNSSVINGTHNNVTNLVVFPISILIPTPTPPSNSNATLTAPSFWRKFVDNLKPRYNKVKDSLVAFFNKPKNMVIKQEKTSIFKSVKDTIYETGTFLANAATALGNSPGIQAGATVAGGAAICVVGPFIYYGLRKCFNKQPQRLDGDIAAAGAGLAVEAVNENLAVNPIKEICETAVTALTPLLNGDKVTLTVKEIKDLLPENTYNLIKDVIFSAKTKGKTTRYFINKMIENLKNYINRN